MITDTKIDTTAEELTEGHPEEFARFMEYTKELEFEEKPDYEYLRGMFRNVSAREGFEYDGKFDWVD